MYSQLGDVSDSLKKIDRRQKTLAEHIRQADNYFEHRELYRQYKQVKPKHQADFYERNRTGLALYEAAAQYLKDVMNGHTTIPTGKWKKEVTQLATEQGSLRQQYDQLKEEVRDAEVIRHCVEQAVREEPEVKRGRTHETEL